MRPIDADAIQIPKTHADAFENCRNCELLDADQVREIINSTPTIDIVRCAECKHWHNGVCWGIPFSGDDASYIETESNDFCSYGEVRDE